MLTEIFSTVLLPIVLIVSAGFVVGQVTGINSRPLAVVVFYLFNLAVNSTVRRRSSQARC